MAHFAKVNTEGVVEEVIVVDNNDILDSNGEEQESIGQEYLRGVFGEISGNWVQTSYNGSFRSYYASIGGTYDTTLDMFIPIKPYNSWVWSATDNSWVAPVARPQPLEDPFGFEIETVSWNEDNLSWEVTSAPMAHYARYNGDGSFEGTIVSMPLDYILDEEALEDNELGVILAVDYRGVGDWRRVYEPVA